jgi:hypothetical protein
MVRNTKHCNKKRRESVLAQGIEVGSVTSDKDKMPQIIEKSSETPKQL